MEHRYMLEILEAQVVAESCPSGVCANLPVNAAIRGTNLCRDGIGWHGHQMHDCGACKCVPTTFPGCEALIDTTQNAEQWET